MISTITSTQVYNQTPPIVRNNMTHLFIYRLRNYNDLESTVEELSAIYDKKTHLQIYHEAVSEDYSFLYVKLMSKDKRKNVHGPIRPLLKSRLNIFNPKLNYFFIYIYIYTHVMTTLTHFEGLVITYTNGLL